MNLQEIKDSIIGLTPIRARALTKTIIRVVKEEGFPVKVGPEYRPNRVNVGIRAGKIEEVINLG